LNTRLERTNLSEQVASAVIASVLDGTFASGSLLPSEPELARRFGVSRPVIREAVRILATKGVVRSEHGRGVVVLDHTSRPLRDGLALSASRLRVSAREVWETRFLIDVGLAEAAALRRTERDLEQIRSALNHMGEQMSETGSFEVAADEEFHRALVNSAHNAFVALLMEPVTHLNREIANAVGKLDQEGDGKRSPVAHWKEKSLAVHERIYRMIAARDVAGTQLALREHWDLAFAIWGYQLEAALGDLLTIWPPPETVYADSTRNAVPPGVAYLKGE
jgi:DNA-binding FadR family transcriptional regulator